MKNNILTISRTYGSGGRLIGQALAEKLDIPFYDKEIVAMVAKESGLSLEFVGETGEFVGAADMAGTESGNAIYDALSLPDEIMSMTNEVIRKLAEDGPCVIVGRCADYLLRDRDDVLNVFIHAPIKARIARVTGEYGVEPTKAKAEIDRIDKGRANHFRKYTLEKWGLAENYHLALDTGIFGIESSIEMIVGAFTTARLT
jgi:cytidylate kinase